MIPMAQINYALIRFATPGNITHHVGTFLPLKGVLHLHTDCRFEVEGLEIGLLRLGDQLIQVIAIIRQQLTGHLLLDPAVQWAMISLAIALDIHLRACRCPHDRPRITGSPILMDDQDTLHALPCALLEFIHPTAIIGHDVAIEIALVRAAQAGIVHNHDCHLILRMLDTRIVILAIFRCHNAITRKEKRGIF